MESKKTELLRRRTELSPEKRALLERRLRGEAPADSPEATIPRQPSRTQAPLSFAQQRLWFLDQLEPESLAYLVTRAVHLTGQLDVAALEASLDAVIQRHEILRTFFISVDGAPAQVVVPTLTVTIPVLDLPLHPAADRAAAVQPYAMAEASRPFDLTRGPLLRATLLRLAASEHVLLLTMHHIITDGWSLGVLVRDLAAYYIAQCSGRPVMLAPLPLQYADYAVWQRDWLRGAMLETLLAYWRQQLAGALAALALPTDHPRPAVQSTRGAVQHFHLSSALSCALQALSQRAGATLFMILLATFQALLGRYSGQTEVLVGTPVAQRTHAELEELIGFFVNTLVLRTDLSSNPPFAKLLAQVRTMCLEAYAHQVLPFERLVEELHLARDLSHSPLFQALFALQKDPLPVLEAAGLTLRPMEVDNGTAKFDLSLYLTDTKDGLLGAWEYNRDLFESATITRMIGHFQTLLEGVVADPERHLSDLPLLTGAERQQLLVAWNETQAAYPEAISVHRLFEIQAAQTPDAVAMVCANAHLTYTTLNRRASQVAHYLQTLGVRPETCVGIAVERSLDLVVGVLAILKAGGAYVPLDPTYPSERLAFMLADAQVSLLLIQAPLAAMPSAGHARIICLDADRRMIEPMPDTNPVSRAHAENLAYLIYTSGSTGRPKGVQIPHRALVNFLHAMRGQPGLSAADTLLAVTTFSFDIAALELFFPLIVGARLVLVNRATAADGRQLCAALAASATTVLQATPATWYMLIESGWAGTPGLRMLCGGEALPRELANRLLARGTALWNMYGPTETTIWSAVQLVADEDGPVVVGRPIANTQFYLLDPTFQPVPIGVAGELYIGGAGLARGYLNRPDLTAERFVPNPFAEVLGVGCWVLGALSSNTLHPTPNTRLYRTGDLMRYRPDGTLIFLGRLDQQVKVRGFRIELGEIEAMLAQYPAVQEAVVVAREVAPGDTRLVTYVVTSDKLQITSSEDSSLVTRHSSLVTELRAFLKQRLPEYMLPSAFVVLDALPLTPAGKVDRRALPAPHPRRPDLETAFVAPQTPEEVALAQIWAEVLGVARVGRADNFFELGGHSLLATQVLARLRSTFGLELPLRLLFEATTLAALAAALAAHQPSALPPLPPLRPAPRPPILPLSFAQQRLWLLHHLAPHSPAYNLPLAVQLTGPLALPALASSLNRLARRHEVLRTSFPLRDGQPCQLIAPAPQFALLLLDLQPLSPACRELASISLARAQAQQPFDLSRGPLLRATLLRLSAMEHVLLITLHHSIADGWSLGVLLRELAAAYTALYSRHPLTLAPLPLQYADYALWQREWLQGEVLERLLSYWREQLAGAPAVLALPADRPRPVVASGRGAELRFELGRGLRAQAQGLCRQAGTTLFMLLLAAFQALLSRYSGQRDLVVGTAVAQRSHAELENVIGCFVNTLVLRGELGGNPSFMEVLRRVRGMCLGAYAHQALPFERLVEELHIERDLSRHPLFQVMFVLQNTPMAAFHLPELTLQPLAFDCATAKFDLGVELWETQDGLVGRMEYSSDLFDAMTIARMAGHFQTLLEGAVADPHIRLADLSLLTTAEQQQLLVAWNMTDTDYPQDLCIQAFFQAQAARTPDAVALVFEGRPPYQHDLSCPDHRPLWRPGDPETRRPGPSPIPHPPSSVLSPQSLTYSELNRRANQLAYHLRPRGVGPGVCVGLYVERSLDMVIGILGILKAGGAYVALDPAYPPARLAWMLVDAQAPVLLTHARLLEDFSDVMASTQQDSALRRPLVVHLSADWPAIAQAQEENPTSGVTPDHLAYVMYTSGSTGTPKGVAVSHRAIGNRLCWGQAAYPLDASDRVLQIASFGFDIALWETMGPLLVGAQVVLARSGGQRDSAYLVQTLMEQQITVAHFVPSLLQVLVAELRMPALPYLRAILCGGEALTTDLQAEVFARLEVDLLHLYGPTEASISATYWRCRRDSPYSGVPIGYPIANMRVYLLDSNLQLVPAGVPGEIHIGGIGLADGYLKRPDLTAERFVPNPFAEDTKTRRHGDTETGGLTPNTQHPTPNTRLYKTGDRGRYLPDGAIAFLGRLDHQMKLRGFRVELGEIEAMLAQHPAVREAVVVAREVVRGDTRLVAYVVPNREQGTGERGQDGTGRDSASLSPVTCHLSPKELRSFLQERLPDYMVPSAFMVLDTLPLTPTGKVDRQTLPPLTASNFDSAEVLVAPRDALELRLVQIYQDVLGIRPIGVRNNFFACGGNSLSAVRLIARIRQDLEQQVTLATLFQNATVEQLAAAIRRQEQLRVSSPVLVRLQEGDHARRPLFLVHAAEGNVFRYLELLRYLEPDQPLYGLQAQGLDGKQAAYTHLEAMATHYIQALQTVQPEGPYLIGGWSMGGLVAYEMAQQLTAKGQDVALLALVDTYAPASNRFPEDDLSLLIRFAQGLGLTLEQGALDWEQYKQLPVDGLLTSMLELGVLAGAVPGDLGLPQIRQLFDVFKSNVQAMARYIPRPYPGAITLFKAQERSIDEIPADLGWGALAGAGVIVHEVPGDHDTMLRPPHAKILGEQLIRSLHVAERQPA